MEDDLNLFENGRVPYFYKKFLQKKDDLNILKNGRRPQKKYIIYIYNQRHSTVYTFRQPDQQQKTKVKCHNLNENQP